MPISAEQRGRVFELVVGLDLLRLPGDLYYWRHVSDEVDYVYRQGSRVYAIDVKSGRRRSLHGLARFREQFRRSIGLVVTPETYAEFARDPAAMLSSLR